MYGIKGIRNYFRWEAHDIVKTEEETYIAGYTSAEGPPPTHNRTKKLPEVRKPHKDHQAELLETFLYSQEHKREHYNYPDHMPFKWRIGVTQKWCNTKKKQSQLNIIMWSTERKKTTSFAGSQLHLLKNFSWKLETWLSLTEATPLSRVPNQLLVRIKQ